MAQGEKVDRGGLYLVVGGVLFLLLVEGVTFAVSGTLLAGGGIGWAVGLGVGAAILSALVGAGADALAKRAERPSLGLLGPVVLLAGAALCGWLWMVPLLHRSNESFGYQGRYRVEYADGRSETVGGATLGLEAWNARAGAATGATLALLLCGLWMGAGSVRSLGAHAPPQAPGP